MPAEEKEFEQTGEAPPAAVVRRRLPGVEVEAALRRFADLAKQRGLRIFGKVDHAQAAADAGVPALPPTVNVYFGSPEQGTPLMRQRPELAARLPLCLSVHQPEPSEKAPLELTLANPFVGDMTLRKPAQATDQLVGELLDQLGAEPAPATPTGKWAVVACQLHGKWLPETIFQEFVFHLSPDRYHIEWSGLSFPAWVGSYPKSYHGTISWPEPATAAAAASASAASAPLQVDLVPGGGPHQGKTLHGIYQLDQDILKMVFGLPGHQRPRTFAAGAGEVYEVWRRI